MHAEVAASAELEPQASQLRPLMALVSLVTFIIVAGHEFLQSILLPRAGIREPVWVELVVDTVLVTSAAYFALRRQESLHQMALGEATERKRAIMALRESEERYRVLSEASPDDIFIVRQDGILEYVNRRAAEKFGSDPESLVGKLQSEIFAPELAERNRRDIEKVIESGLALYQEVQISFQNRLVWQSIWLVPLKNPTGDVHAVMGVSRDISEQKQAEEALQKERDFISAVIDTVGSLVVVLDRQGRIIRFNRACEQLSGYAFAEVKEKSFVDLVLAPEEAETVSAAFEDLVAGKFPNTHENDWVARDGSRRLIAWSNNALLDAEGAVEYVIGIGMDITERKQAETALRRLRDELEVRVQERTAELAQANVALQLQIAEREAAVKETRTLARQQEAVAELGHRALTAVDMDTLFDRATTLVTSTLDVEISTVLELMPGHDSLQIRAGAGWKSNVIGYVVPGNRDSQAGYALLSNTPTIVPDLRAETRFKPSQLLLEFGIVSGVMVIVGGYEQPFGTLGAHTTRQRLFSQDDVHFLQSMSNVLAAAIGRNQIETSIRQLNQQLKESNKQLKRENAERKLALGALREVTVGLEQAKEEADLAREEAERANTAKSEFLSRMSHELRTPMNAILGFAQILEMRGLGPVESESVDHILNAGQRLLELINEVLDITGIEAGRMVLSLEPVGAADIVNEALDLVQPLASPREIQLASAVAEQGSWHVLADRQRLTQVLFNILSNAVKYNREAGLVTVSGEIHAAETVGASETLRLSVTDTGFGLSAGDLSRLFVPFERLGATQTGVEGKGMGLTMSRLLVEAMGGKMGVESTVGVGSVFWIELPLALGPTEPGRHLEAQFSHVTV